MLSRYRDILVLLEYFLFFYITAGQGIRTRRISLSQCNTYPDEANSVLISGQECHLAIDTLGRHICYEHWFRTKRCCGRCLQLRNNRHRGCEWGDRSSACATIQARACYVNRNKRICCDTCRRLKNNAAPNCEYGDMSDDCLRMPRGLCNIAENQRICCATCARSRNHTNPSCPWGDQSSQCFHIRRIDCYSDRTKSICCEMCQRIRTDIPGCPYGNRALQCENLNSGDCYDEDVRNSCCQTCRAHYTGVVGCEYGDRNVIFSTPSGRLGCQLYIQVYGNSYCNTDVTAGRCCASCRGYVAPTPTT